MFDEFLIYTDTLLIFLGIKDGGVEAGSFVVLEEKNTNINLTQSQMWLRSKADNDGYFSLQNPISGLYLTAESETETVIGDLGNLTYPPKIDLNEIFGPK